MPSGAPGARIAAAASVVMSAGCAAGHAPISRAEYGELARRLPGDLVVVQEGKWALMEALEPRCCARSRKGTITMVGKVTAGYRIRTSDIADDEGEAESSGREYSPRGDR